MSNHIHLLAKATREGALSSFMRSVNGEYSSYLHGRLCRKGRLWQGRFYSCVVEESRLTTVLLYVERNPVRASMVAQASDYEWSSARAHLGIAPYPDWLDRPAFTERWTLPQWHSLLHGPQGKGEVAAIRQATRLERPFGSESFLETLHRETNLPAQAFAPAKKLPASLDSASAAARFLACS